MARRKKSSEIMIAALREKGSGVVKELIRLRRNSAGAFSCDEFPANVGRPERVAKAVFREKKTYKGGGNDYIELRRATA